MNYLYHVSFLVSNLNKEVLQLRWFTNNCIFIFLPNVSHFNLHLHKYLFLNDRIKQLIHKRAYYTQINIINE